MTRHRFYGAFRETWYSICSMHGGEPKDDCHLCQTGQWKTDAWVTLRQWVFAADPDFWRSEVNRPDSPDRAWLERVFPNLRGGS